MLFHKLYLFFLTKSEVIKAIQTCVKHKRMGKAVQYVIITFGQKKIITMSFQKIRIKKREQWLKMCHFSPSKCLLKNITLGFVSNLNFESSEEKKHRDCMKSFRMEICSTPNI